MLALGAAAAGTIGIVSALTPEFANRSDFVAGVLPPGVPEAARVLALAFGIVLIWTSRGLARRRRRAWKLAVGVVVLSAVAHMAKGLDFEESTATLVLLAALWHWRGAFVVRGDPQTRWPLAQALAGLAAAGLLIWLRTSDQVTYSERVEEALIGIVGALALRALYLWFRPHIHRGAQSPAERVAAEEIVREEGRDSLCYFALRRDKSWFFSASGRSFLAFKVVQGIALVSGDPIGEPAELPELVRAFEREAHARGWRVAIVGAGEDSLAVYRELGFRTLYFGDEAIVNPVEFSLEGRPIRKVRQSVARLHKAGYSARVLEPAELDDELRAQIDEVSSEWLGGGRERGFSMAMDALFSYPESAIVIAEDEHGLVGGFMQLVPAPATNGYSLATMRRRLDTPNGLMEFMIVEALEWAKEREVPEVSLEFRAVRAGHACRRDLAARTPRGAAGSAARRSLLPDRAAAHVQQEVLPGLASPVSRLRALRRPAARRARLRPSGGLPRPPAGAVAADPGGRSRMRPLAVALATVALALPAASAQARSSLSLKPYAGGFAAPLYATAPRSESGKLYVVEQAGLIWRLVDGKRQRTPFLDVRGRTASGGERGLLSVAFSPGYARNRLLYVDYTDRNGDTRVVRYRSNGVRAIPSSAKQLLFVKQPYPNHNGGQLQFGPDGLLYVGMGDGGSGGDPQNHAQTLSSRLGKLLLLRGSTWRIAAYGLRNPWRFSFDRETGDLFIGDVGQNEIEEVDILPRGFGLSNLGWHVFEGDARYQDGQQPNPAGTLVAPVATYHHGDDGCSITGGYVYHGADVPAAKGRYFYGDYCSGKIWSFLPAGGKATDLRQEALHVDSLTSFGEDARGELYAVSGSGTVYRLAS